MELLSARELEQAAAHRLSQASYPPRKLALIHSGIAAAAAFLLSLISFLLSQQIGNTAGLGGIGIRTALESVQYILQLALSLALPFWQVGFVFCALSIARGVEASPANLSAGFHRFAPLLRLWLLQSLIYFAAAFAAIQLASILISFTPFAAPMMEVMEQLASDADFLQTGTVPQELLEALLPTLIPVYVAAALVFLVLALPLFYRFRLAQYVILDEAHPRARIALHRSRTMMRGNAIALFKVDLHFWWYYLLQLLIAAVAYLDVLLPLLGISLPIGADVGFFLFYLVHLGLDLWMAWQFGSRVETVYACAYDSLLPTE